MEPCRGLRDFLPWEPLYFEEEHHASVQGGGPVLFKATYLRMGELRLASARNRSDLPPLASDTESERDERYRRILNLMGEIHSVAGADFEQSGSLTLRPARGGGKVTEISVASDVGCMFCDR